jgi:hypothetical protein
MQQEFLGNFCLDFIIDFSDYTKGYTGLSIFDDGNFKSFQHPTGAQLHCYTKKSIGATPMLYLSILYTLSACFVICNDI